MHHLCRSCPIVIYRWKSFQPFALERRLSVAATFRLFVHAGFFSPINKSAVLKFASRLFSFIKKIMGSLYFKTGDEIFDLKFLRNYDNGRETLIQIRRSAAKVL